MITINLDYDYCFSIVYKIMCLMYLSLNKSEKDTYKYF